MIVFSYLSSDGRSCLSGLEVTALSLANSLLLLLAGTTGSRCSTALSPPLSGLFSLLLGDRLSMLLM